MALSREIYAAFEAIVGKRNISEDPGVLETYRCAAAQSSAHYGPYDHKTPRPQAVLLPGSAEEARSIVKLCNKYDIKFKAATTFWSAMGFIGDDYAIQMDMRRMRSIEIDEKNMAAIIEPYAIGAVVQAEADEAGPHHEHAGRRLQQRPPGEHGRVGRFRPHIDIDGLRQREHARRGMGAPQRRIAEDGLARRRVGLVLREGPGPSARAILRGFQGSTGSLGVCTRIAIRLHPGPGRPRFPRGGLYPRTRPICRTISNAIRSASRAGMITQGPSRSSTRTRSFISDIGSSTCSAGI